MTEPRSGYQYVYHGTLLTAREADYFRSVMDVSKLHCLRCWVKKYGQGPGWRIFSEEEFNAASTPRHGTGSGSA